MSGAGRVPDWPRGTVAILATVDEAGTPYAVPVSTARRAGRERVLLALATGRGSLARLRARPHVALAILGAGDLAFTLRGRAQVVEERLAGAEGVAAVAVEVESVDDHDRATFRIDAGVDWRWTDSEAGARDGAVQDALARLA